jgi:hypothetical protein
VSKELQLRRPSASASRQARAVPKTARERILLALELGQLGRLVQQLGKNVRGDR